MQGRNRPLKQDPSTSSLASSATHTPQQWFRPLSNRSVPNLAKAQHQNRSLGFSSIRDLARTSRRPLAALSANTSQPPEHTLRASNSLYGTLRDQCSPPPPSPTDLPAPPAVVLRRSHSSSANSFTPDQSGASIDSSQITTPSPAKHYTFYEIGTSPGLQLESMGNKASSIIRKPLTITGKCSVTGLDDEQQKSSDSETKEYSENKPPATFSPRGSSLIVKVPRRRSSLTVLHLDNSHFNTPDPKQPSLRYSTSTTTQLRERRASTLAETLRPVLSEASTLTPANVAQKRESTQNRESTLSPPLLSPTSRISSTSSQSPSTAAPSPNPRSSVIGTRIHLPKTFPEGPIPIAAPQLTRTHHQCYARHKKMMKSPQGQNPVPCMACGGETAEMSRCTFCYLRICARCIPEFDKRRRNLGGLLEWVRREKGKGRADEGGKQVVAHSGGVAPSAAKEDGEDKDRKEDVEKAMEESALKKVETARKRETR